MTRHLTRLMDLDASTLADLVARGGELRQGAAPRRAEGKLLGLVFEKPSTRTRVSLEAAAHRLGADHLFVTSRDSQLQRGEPVKDTARVLGGYLDAIAMRTFAQATIDESAAYAEVPVINALSDRFHPCQAIADVMTAAAEFGNSDDFCLAYLGDGNNVFASLAEAACLLGFQLRFAGPAAYAPEQELIDELQAAGLELEITTDAAAAVKGADVLYTDVWTSMGQEDETAERRKALAPYQINEELLAAAPEHAIVLHCLPAHRGEEITGPVLEGAASRVFAQAENRMWGQMALLEHLWDL